MENSKVLDLWHLIGCVASVEERPVYIVGVCISKVMGGVEDSESGRAWPLYLGLVAVTGKSEGVGSFCSIEFG